jgi:osmoprotectant transport system permease protein
MSPHGAMAWLLGLAMIGSASAAEPVVVGAKKFTESVILAEMAGHLIRDGGAAAQVREFGGTRTLWQALVSGQIDLYPEYTGTLMEEILADAPGATQGPEAMQRLLEGRGIRMSRPLGFNNTYALGMLEAKAAELGVREISDLGEHPELRFGFSNEFMDREDGWPGLRRRYGLPQTGVTGLDHDLAYRGLAAGTLDVTDTYSTDAEVEYYGLRVLKDDRAYFPDYQAVFLYRADLGARLPDAVAALRRLEARLSAADMVRLNARAKLEKVSEERVAADFLGKRLGVQARVVERGWVSRLGQHTRAHLFLVGVSLAAAILVAVPLGILAARRPRLGQLILGVTGVLQTIPSLALLVFMIPLLGIGAGPAIVALFLYSLLPIVRNTYAGLRAVAGSLRESAEALGLPAGARLRLVELPMASPAVLAGVKTSAVINVGTATLGALIGAGGYGQPILTGIRLDDTALILSGAVPAALMALMAQGLFELVERRLVPRGLRL